MGFDPPAIPPEYTEFDMLAAYAMFYADYWLMRPTRESAADFVYCLLSDPDYPNHHKIWDYLMGE